MKKNKVYKKNLFKRLKFKFIDWIFKELTYDYDIRNIKNDINNIKDIIKENRTRLIKLEDFKDDTFKDIEQLYKQFNDEEKRQDLFNKSVYRFLPKVYEVYHKNLELSEFRNKYAFNSDAKELRKFTEEKIEEEIKEILKRVQ